MEQPAEKQINIEIDALGSFDYDNFHDNLSSQQCIKMLQAEITAFKLYKQNKKTNAMMM